MTTILTCLLKGKVVVPVLVALVAVQVVANTAYGHMVGTLIVDVTHRFVVSVGDFGGAPTE